MTYIGLGRRFVAWVIDGLITSVAWVAFAETESGDGSYSITWQGLDFVLPLLISLAYFVLLEGTLGATIGKLVLGIRVRHLDGARIGLGPAAIRNVARVVDAFPYVIPYVVGAVAVSRSQTKQRLGDRWAGTVVILIGTDRNSASTPAEPPEAARDPLGLPSPPPGVPPVDTRDGSLPPPPPSP